MRIPALRLLTASLFLFACGKVDGGADASTVDADQSGDATVITQTALLGGTLGARVGDIDIVSSLPDNTVFATAKTDANGGATIKVYPGGSVTAIYKHTIDMGADLITWAGVKPGDTLTFSNRSPSSNLASTVLGSQTYSWPAVMAATSFRVYTSCGTFAAGAGATSLSFSELSTCHKEPMDVVFGALDGAGKIIAVGFRSNVAFTSGGTVTLSGWTTTAAMMGSINITGLPSEVTSVNGNFQPVFDSVNVASLAAAYNGTPTGGAYSTTFSWLPTGERTLGSLFLARSGFRQMQIHDSFSTSTFSQTVAAPGLPPWAQGNTTASSALRSASWFLVSDATSVHDGQLLSTFWNRKIGDKFHPFQWHFILPPGQTSITFPSMPPVLADFQPMGQDSMSATTRIFELPSVTDYDMLRTLPSGNLMCLECSVRAGDFQRAIFTQL